MYHWTKKELLEQAYEQTVIEMTAGRSYHDIKMTLIQGERLCEEDAIWFIEDAAWNLKRAGIIREIEALHYVRLAYTDKMAM